MAADEDRISGLSDDLLLAIVLRLRSAHDAVRTSVLSLRWLNISERPPPELVYEDTELVCQEGLEELPPRLESFLDNVDAALAACDAPVLKGLRIVWMLCGPLSVAAASGLPTGRVESWLRFASERVVDDLDMDLPPLFQWGLGPGDYGEEAVLQLPLCEWVKRIQLCIGPVRIRPPSTGLLRALANLTIRFGRMDGNELTALVCTQCPGLRDLNLMLRLVGAFDVSIRSDSLQSLSFDVGPTMRLQIVAPRLQKLILSNAIDEARITAPKLKELAWPQYDPRRHQFVGVSHCLRMLKSGQNASLMQQFDEVDELRLEMFIPQEIAGYERFLNETNRLPKCNLLDISSVNQHALVPGMLHLLRSCNSTREVFLHVVGIALVHPCLPSCPCRKEESYRIDDISLSSLERA